MVYTAHTYTIHVYTYRGTDRQTYMYTVTCITDTNGDVMFNIAKTQMYSIKKVFIYKSKKSYLVLVESQDTCK